MAETNMIPFPMGELQIHLPECLHAQVEQGVLIPIEEEDREKDAPVVGVQRARKSFPFRTGRMTTVPKALRAVLVGGRTPGGALHRSTSPYFVPTHAQLRRNQRRFRRSISLGYQSDSESGTDGLEGHEGGGERGHSTPRGSVERVVKDQDVARQRQLYQLGAGPGGSELVA